MATGSFLPILPISRILPILPILPISPILPILPISRINQGPRTNDLRQMTTLGQFACKFDSLA
ncbi:hypothetical protein [Laspinema olomoucense]|uniref:hypothetical protein n=1 Tax=Laspinema olomoucense TaxID=3231600 RepID=UPI0021BA73AA|nr:hypothetical protein [Laspinema sp. D3d]MCT7970663.1 hypothetical protein [Laspinema sp. D3d]